MKPGGSFLVSRVGGLLQLLAGAVLVALGFSQVVGVDQATFQQIFGGALCTVGGMQVAVGLLLFLGAIAPGRQDDPG